MMNYPTYGTDTDNAVPPALGFDAFSHDVIIWSMRNFGDATACPPRMATVGLIEEAGELCRAVIKRHERIRGTREEWSTEIAKELGDVVIKIADVAGRADILPLMTTGAGSLQCTWWGNDLRGLQWAIARLDRISTDRLPSGIDMVALDLVIAIGRLSDAVLDFDSSFLGSDMTMTARCWDVLAACARIASAEKLDLSGVVRARWTVVGARDWTTDTVGHGMPSE